MVGEKRKRVGCVERITIGCWSRGTSPYYNELDGATPRVALTADSALLYKKALITYTRVYGAVGSDFSRF